MDSVKFIGLDVLELELFETDVLIVGNNPGSKLAKARELEIEILTEQEIIDLIN